VATPRNRGRTVRSLGVDPPVSWGIPINYKMTSWQIAREQEEGTPHYFSPVVSCLGVLQLIKK
jgi:hypothetical protein